MPDPGTPDRIKAKLLGAVLYETFCQEHGLVYHFTKNGLCSGCYDQNGVIKSGGRRGPRLTNEPRAVARREGSPAYEAQCATHGLTWHSVQHGKCLTCFSTSGVRRVSPAPIAAKATARADARRAGADTYLGSCERHGETPHSVKHGRCLSCFTTAGVARKFAPRVPLPPV